ncbi:MAG: hypothetical protein IKE21_03225 [Erysipelotrichaceae bacterium]|nr:hypothetical protein [Erysipelotrichaceae bacterium]
MELTEQEIKALCFYEGDAEGSDPFWGDKKAYLTLNSLLYPGLRNERDRTAEGKKLNPAILEEEKYPLLAVYRNLLSAVCKDVRDYDRHTWRVERYSDFRQQQSVGRTLSFTSTSKAGFLKVFQDRIGIALLKVTIPAGVPALDFEEALPHYAKADEHEVLLPPFLRFSFKEVPLTEEEMEIRDAAGQPPRIACEATVSLPRSKEKNTLISLPFPEPGKRVYAALNKGQEPQQQDIADYLAYKAALQRILHREFDSLTAR